MQQGESSLLVCLSWGLGGLDTTSTEDLLVGFALGFVRPADIPRRKTGCPGQWHHGKREGSWRGCRWLGVWVTLQPGPHLSPSLSLKNSGVVSGLMGSKVTFLWAGPGSVPRLKADTISLSDLQLQQDQPDSCVLLPGGGARSLLKSLS